MEQKITDLKKLNAAYIAALEYDYCPSSSKSKRVAKLFDTGVPEIELRKSLDENRGSRPDEIVSKISELIKDL